MRNLLFISFIFYHYSSCLSVLTTEKRLPLIVEQGKSAYLSQAHIPFNRSLHFDLCQIEVDDVQPLSSVAGFLKPKKFPCNFEPSTVLYQHEGSSLTFTDTILLNIYFFRKQYASKRNLTIHVTIVPPKRPSRISVRSQLNVPSLKGISQPISTSLIRIQYDPMKEFCRIKHLNQASVSKKLYPWLAFRFWPNTGILITFNKSKMYEFNFECQQTLLMGLRFMHRKSRSPPVDFLPLVIEISRMDSDEMIDVTYLHIPIQVSAKSTNAITENKLPPPVVRAFRAVTLKNSGGTVSIVPSDCLELSNLDKDRDPLVVEILKINGKLPAAFRNLRDLSKDISSFTFNDLVSGLITFQLKSYDETVRNEFLVTLVVMDSYFVKSQPILLQIINILENPDLPFQVFTLPFYTYTSSNRPLRNTNIQIFGNIDLNLVRYRFVNLKLDSGSFYKIPSTSLLNAPPRGNLYFNRNDTETNSVYFRHGGSLKEADSVTVEVSIDRFRSIKIQLPIYIVCLHNRTKEYLLDTHMEFSTAKDGLLNINVMRYIHTNFYFNAIVRDLIDVSFDIINPPLYGNIVRLLPGQRISSFSSRLSFLKFQDFLDGLIFYQNDANYPTARDNLEMRQHGRTDEETIKIILHVQHYGIDFLTANMNRRIIFTVTETSQYQKLSYLNLNYASYSVRSYEFKTEDVIYEIVRFPRYDGVNETIDAGRLISLKSIQNDVLVGDTALTTKITNYRLAHITSVTYFSQKQILEDDIVYISPLDDIGPDDRKVSFMYSVRYKEGYEKRNIRFPILIKAVNNQPPFLKSFNITVPRDEEIFLNSNSLEVHDEDTKLENIFIEFISLPIYGFMYESDSQILGPGYKFKANKLLIQALKYKHNGHNVNKDKFNVRLLDGVHTSQIYSIEINITKRALPTSTWNLYINNTVLVKENSTVILHPSIFQNVLKGFDFKTFFNPMFILVALPTRGSIVNGKVVVSTFNFLEVKSGKIGYQHSSIEIGSKSQLDFTQVWILDTGDSFNLNFTILPVNSQPPALYSQIPLQVNEGGFVIINYYAISFKDLDSDEREIFIDVLKAPRRGKICVKGQMTPIQTFSLADIKRGKIIYNNSLSGNGSEFTTDVFTVVGTDGKFSSPPLDVQIFIHSMNDEPPILILNNFNVAVGQNKVLDENIFQLSDADIPRDNLQIKFILFPKYGDLTLKSKYGEIRQINKLTAPLTLQQLNFASFVYVQNASGINEQRTKFPVKDSFQLSVFDGKFTVRKTVVVNITGFNRVAPLIISSLIKLDKINEKTITPTDLSASDPDTLPEDIIFKISKLPDKGSLFLLEKRLSVLQSFSQNDINQGKLLYKYLGPSVTYTQDYFLIKLFDGKFEVNGKKVFIFLTQPIQIPKMSINISPIKINIGQKFVWNKGLITITNPVLDIMKSLVLTVKGKLTCGAFYYYRNLDFPIFKFTYEDIKERKIVFLISECPDSIHSFNVEFSFFSRKSFELDLIVPIEVIPRVSSIPSLRRNSTIHALVGSNMVLTKDMLYSFDEDTPSDGLIYQYMNVNQPSMQLLVNKVPETNFSQHDINAERVELCFEEEINTTQIMISLLLSDGENLGYMYKTSYQSSGLINLTIILSKWRHENLILMKYGVPNQMRLIDGYSGFQWSYNDLLVSRPDAKISVARDLVAGFFYNIETKRSVASFYQTNINRGNIYYLLNREKSTKIYKELIQFKIFYQKFRISSETLEISWSIVEFEKIKYKLCPQRGLLTINVIRTGNLTFSSQATVGFVSLEAVINQDFRLMSQRLLIFSPGENKKVISIKILMTGSLVKENKFQITLQFPKQAIFGQKSTATVSIKNRKTCNGKDYFHPEKIRSIPSTKESSKNTKNMLQDRDYVFHDMNQENDNQDLPSSEELETHYKNHIAEQKFTVRCDQNWFLFSQRCYHPFTTKLSWTEADKFCSNRKSFLTSINSDILLRWMVKLFRKPRPFWFGLHKTRSEGGKWQYVNNEAILYTNWDVRFPKSNGGTLKECAMVTKKAKWKNRPCHKKRRSFICMKNPEVDL